MTNFVWLNFFLESQRANQLMDSSKKRACRSKSISTVTSQSSISEHESQFTGIVGSMSNAVMNLRVAPARSIRKPKWKYVSKAVSALLSSVLHKVSDNRICYKVVSKKENTVVTVHECSTAPAESVWVCVLCGFAHGDENDPLFNEDLLSCSLSRPISRYHEKCAEEAGVLDDDGRFTCKRCMD
jgi:hypothetical protein